MPLNVIGTGSEKLHTLTITKEGATMVSGVPMPYTFTPTAQGIYLIEATSTNSTLRIWKYITIQ